MKPPIFYRTFELDERAIIDPDKRTAELSFSSENPVERWFGKEILLHGVKNADFGRLRSVGAVLYGHNSKDISNIIGPIKKVWIDENRIGRAIIGFDDDDTGNIALKKVQSKSLRGVSFAYTITKVRQLHEKEEWEDPDTKKKYQGPALIATEWHANEISLTPVPADASVGIGRSLDGVEIETATLNQMEVNTMDEKEVRALVDSVLKETIPQIITQVRSTMAEEARPKMAVSVEQSKDLLARAAAVSPETKLSVMDRIMDGKHETEILRFINDEAIKDPDSRDTGDLGGEGTGRGKQTPKGPAIVGSFKQVTDDMFFNGLKNPSAFPMQ